jgi:transposase-like protein
VRKQYSEKFKERMVARMLGERTLSTSALSKEVGIGQPTLSR